MGSLPISPSLLTMSKSKCDRTLEFILEGQFLGFILKDGYKIKYLRLSAPTGEYIVKLSKEVRASLGHTLLLGEWLQVVGYQDLDEKRGTIKFKAHQIMRVAPDLAQISAPTGQDIANKALLKGKASILICQKSDCCKRGGWAVFEAVQKALSDQNLIDQITIRPTGCMKQCKSGPNIVMPDKTRYSQVRPAEIPALVDKHCQSSPVHAAEMV